MADKHHKIIAMLAKFYITLYMYFKSSQYDVGASVSIVSVRVMLELTQV